MNEATNLFLRFTGKKSVAYGGHRRPLTGRLEMKTAGKGMIDE
ncbi:hypothetical protein BJ988_005205 [Nocardioides panzhihuensis]|uniref:Uncharacterized protein n=1 Tax=Nocardioides panzhihuensis TaxID=860243 RepID=A0A7Z0IV17_9ACTN|nr:hypothetical protein [Nocardioides panzhihuensis]